MKSEDVMHSRTGPGVVVPGSVTLETSDAGENNRGRPKPSDNKRESPTKIKPRSPRESQKKYEAME